MASTVGSIVGGIIGTLIMPGIGTAIGSGLGSAAGAKMSGSSWGSAAMQGVTTGIMVGATGGASAGTSLFKEAAMSTGKQIAKTAAASLLSTAPGDMARMTASKMKAGNMVGNLLTGPIGKSAEVQRQADSDRVSHDEQQRRLAISDSKNSTTNILTGATGSSVGSLLKSTLGTGTILR